MLTKNGEDKREEKNCCLNLRTLCTIKFCGSEDGLEILKEKLGCLAELKNIMYCNQMWNQKMKWRRTRSWVVARIHRSMSSRFACFRIVLKLCCNCPAMPNIIPNCPNHLQQKWKPASEVHQI
jgi:hypothetical protein